MSVQQTITKIKKGDFSPIYILFGEEDFLKDEIKRSFLTTIFPDGVDELNFTNYDLEETGLVTVLGDAQELPFFGDRKLIFADHASFFSAKRGVKEKEETLNELLEYLTDPVEETILVFTLSENLDGKKKIVKAAKKNGVVVECSRLREEEVKNYIFDLFRREEVEIEKFALDELLVRCNYSITQAVNETKKISNLHRGTKITKKEVESLVSKSVEQNVFDLSTAILRSDVDTAIVMVEDLLMAGETAIGLNALFLSQIRLFLQVKFLLSVGKQQGEIAQILGGHPFRIQKAMQEVRNFSKSTLSTIYQKSVDLDESLKSTSFMEPKAMLQLFVVDIARIVQQR